MPTMSRRQIVEFLNGSGLANRMADVREAASNYVYQKLTGKSATEEPEDNTKEGVTKRMRAKDLDLLNHLGPAAAGSAIQNCVARLIRTKQLQPVINGKHFSRSNPHKNMQILMNDCPVEGYPAFSNVLRQFLLPRYAYLDFDTITDPRHAIDQECGYPKFITPIMYRYMYDRDDMARRVVDILPNECWAVTPNVYETEDEKENTDFEKDFKTLCNQKRLLQYMYRIDRLAGIGHYGALLLGIDDGKDLDQPIDEEDLLAGVSNSISKVPRKLLYMRPFDEYLSFIHQYETDIFHPRYGLPNFYNLVFLDMTIDAAGASIGTRLNRRVHWSRIVHVADNLQSSLVFGTPRMQPVFNRLLDLRKIKGGSGEMFWKGAFPGYSFEVDPRFVPDDPNDLEFDEDKIKEQIEQYSMGLTRYLSNIGISVKSLAPQVADPTKHVKMLVEAVAMYMDVPVRVFMGSEEGRLASGQDKLTWNTRLKRRISMFVNDNVIRNTIDRFVAIGVIRPPTGRLEKDKNAAVLMIGGEEVTVNQPEQFESYYIDWPDINKPTDEDKANLSLKWTQALSQYISSGCIHFITPEEYLMDILGLAPQVALRMVEKARKQPGWDKLLKVDPSQGSGQNGVAENNVSKGKREGTAASRPRERDTNQKKIEGSSS